MVQYLSVNGEKQHQVLSSQSQHTPLHSEFGSRQCSFPMSDDVLVIVSWSVQKVIAVFVI